MTTSSARVATVEDYEQFVRFFVQLATLDPPLGRDWWAKSFHDALFLEEGGVPVGFAYAYPLGSDGHVSQVVVDAPARGRGVGRALMNAVAARLRAKGCVHWALNVEHENQPALALYRRCGMRVRFAVDTITIAWDALDALPTDETVIVEQLEPEHDAALESALAVPAGWIRRVRRIPGRCYAMARRGEEPYGVLAFDPVTSSTVILRARSIATARMLLDAVRATRRPDSPTVRLYVEDDVALTTGLVDVGGRVVMRMLRMEGALPEPSP
jgi:GNAT superfamily N-acetyltransferase